MRPCASPSSDRFFFSPATTSPHLVPLSSLRLRHRHNITVRLLDRLLPSRLRAALRASSSRMHVLRIARRSSNAVGVGSRSHRRVADRADVSTVRRSLATTRSRLRAMLATIPAASPAGWIGSRSFAVRTASTFRRRHVATLASRPERACSANRIGVTSAPSWVAFRVTSSPFARPPARSACACTSTESPCSGSR